MADLLLSVRALSARELPALPSKRHCVRAQVSLNGELQETGASTWGQGTRAREVEWAGRDSQLMMWRLSPQTLQTLKKRSPTVKLMLYASIPDAPSKEAAQAVALGWVFLDLRTPNLPAQWMRLLNGRGEVRVATSLRVAPADTGEEQEQEQQQQQQAEQERWDEASEASEAEFLDLAPGDPAAVFFAFKVTVSSAEALDALPVPDTARVAAGPFRFAYDVFEVPVDTEEFSSLSRPDFPPICDSFRVKATLAVLREHFRSPLRVHLCSGSAIIATAVIPLGALAPTSATTEADFSAQRLCASFPFGGANASAREGRPVPALAAAVALEREGAPAPGPVPAPAPAAAPAAASAPEPVEEEKEEKQEEKAAEAEDAPGARKLLSVFVRRLEVESTDDEDDLRARAARGVSLAVGDAATTALAVGEYGEFEDDVAQRLTVSEPHGGAPIALRLLNGAGDVLGVASLAVPPPGAEASAELRLEPRNGGEPVGACSLHVAWAAGLGETAPRAAAMAPLQVHNPVGPSEPVHSRLSIRLAELKELGRPTTVFLYYRYGAVGIRRQVRSQTLHAEGKAVAVDCFHSIELDTSRSDLTALLGSEPLCVEVWRSDRYTTEQLGVATFVLGDFFKQAEVQFRCPHSNQIFATHGECARHIRRAGGEGRPQAVYALEIDAPVIAGLDEPRRVAQLSAVVVFEEFAAMEPSAAAAPAAAPAAVSAGGAPTAAQAAAAQAAAPAAVVHAAERAELLADARAEFEQWRSGEEEKWRARLQQQEREQMMLLQHEWEAREKEREEAVTAVQGEYARLEAKLRKSLAEVEARERRLLAAEEESRRRANQRMADLELLQRRVQTEAEHSVKLEKRKVQALEHRLQLAEASTGAAERRAREVETEFAAYRRQQRATPETALRQQIAKLQGEAQEMEAQLQRERGDRALQATETEKYRGQVLQLAKALHRERLRLQEKSAQDVEQLRLQYVAREQRYALDGDRDELRKIKRELDQLRHVQALSSPGQTPPPSSASSSSSPVTEAERSASSSGLRQERELLLATGVYGPDHPMVQQLDAMIAQEG